MEVEEAPKASTIKSYVMGGCVVMITFTICTILASYAIFSMYHNKELGSSQLELFSDLSNGLKDILIMFFTAESVHRKLKS